MLGVKRLRDGTSRGEDGCSTHTHRGRGDTGSVKGEEPFHSPLRGAELRSGLEKGWMIGRTWADRTSEREGGGRQRRRHTSDG